MTNELQRFAAEHDLTDEQVESIRDLQVAASVLNPNIDPDTLIDGLRRAVFQTIDFHRMVNHGR